MACLDGCLHQVFKPEYGAGSSFLYNGNGAGNCSVCTYDPNNNNYCARYTPIKFWISEVVDEEKAK